MAQDDGAEQPLKDQLAELYPVVSDQVRGALQRRGAPPWVVEDVISEAFARALTTPPTCPSTAFPAWIQVVARNAYFDWCREQSRYVGTSELPEEHVEDVAETVERRARYLLVREAVSHLTEEQRDAFRDLLDNERPAIRDRAAIVRLAARRYRARATLTRLLNDPD